MGVKIDSVTLAGNPLNQSYLRSGAKAIRKGIRSFSDEFTHPGMIINTGVYPDKYIQEPAFASLLQGRLKTQSKDDFPETFSFDLHEGGGGLILALRILNGFLETQKIASGLVVAGDNLKPSYAGAVFLSASAEIGGFRGFEQYIYTEYLGEYNSYTTYLNGKLKLIIEQSDKYIEYSEKCVKESLTKFLRDQNLELNEIDLIITSQFPVGFATRVNEMLTGDRVVVIKNSRHLYSAGIVFALYQAFQSGRFSRAKKILFFSAGPGITVDMALYCNE